ncbi:hypothetical protein NDU88_005435 [Pleurodeles waltl]|uniref:Uncharacterized protein n=1 Tax=Pleurodeles waltl TaxID=8319 RepID=A0AAV7LP60_PLEWA|nr:hypothetical protein NDU88_005435 [Pleurodeles waltl]
MGLDWVSGGARPVRGQASEAKHSPRAHQRGAGDGRTPAPGPSEASGRKYYWELDIGSVSDPGRIRLPQSGGELFKSPPKKASPSLPFVAAGCVREPTFEVPASLDSSVFLVLRRRPSDVGASKVPAY